MASLRLVLLHLAAVLLVAPWAGSAMGTALTTEQLASVAAETEHLPGVVLVGLRAGPPPGESSDVIEHAGQGVPGPARVVRTIPGIGVQVVRVEAGQEEAWLSQLRADPRVAFAELDHRASLAEPRLPRVATSPAALSSLSREEMAVVPNDPALPQQWYLARLRMSEAWGVGTGSPSPVIAVVDSGLTMEHPDLASKLWTNAGEVAENGRDDDGNGKVDDIHGWHFYHFFTGLDYEPGEDADISDPHGHGTHVAGIAAAATNNGIGIAGVSWGARIMVLRVMDSNGNGWYSDIAAGIAYAVDNGARIINLSLGGPSPSAVVCEAVAYAHSHGSLVLAATGKTGGAVLYPAACPQAMAVAATDQQDRTPSFSNRGPEVDISAPGTDIYSTYNQLDGYTTMSGTSMATPQVSGLASLVWSRWPMLGSSAVAQQLTCTAVDIDVPGPDNNTGYGRIDAAAATRRLCVQPQRVLLPWFSNQHADPAAYLSPSIQTRR